MGRGLRIGALAHYTWAVSSRRDIEQLGDAVENLRCLYRVTTS